MTENKNYFEFGKMIDISKLCREDAISIFGEPLYEAWRNSFGQSSPGEHVSVAIRIKSVNRMSKTIEVEIN